MFVVFAFLYNKEHPQSYQNQLLSVFINLIDITSNHPIILLLVQRQCTYIQHATFHHTNHHQFSFIMVKQKTRSGSKPFVFASPRPASLKSTVPASKDNDKKVRFQPKRGDKTQTSNNDDVEDTNDSDTSNSSESTDGDNEDELEDATDPIDNVSTTTSTQTHHLDESTATHL